MKMANKGYFWAAPLCLAAGVSLLAGCAHQFELVQPVKKNFQRELSKYRPLVPSEPTCMIGFQYTEDSLVVTVASENARRAGLRPGDLILSVEGQEIVKRADIEENFEKKSAGDEIRLGIMRADHPLHLVAMCQDRQKALQRFVEVLSYGADGHWDECIVGSYDLERTYGPAAYLSSVRLHCSEARRSLEGRLPDIHDAQLGYESNRRRIIEASYSTQGLDPIRGDILGQVAWLEGNGFASFASDLQAQFDAALAEKPDGRSPRSAILASSGTCFAVAPEGLLVTAHHVVANAASITVTLSDGRNVGAVVEEISPSNDLAVLRTQQPVNGYLTLAPSRSAAVGQEVFTMGFPAKALLGEEPKFTDGTISALSGPGGEALFLQISVPVQPGSSGGPLLNNSGEVLGVITSTAAILPFLRQTGKLPQNVNWAVKAEYASLLFDHPEKLPPTADRMAAIERSKAAVCAIEATRD